MCSLLCSFLSRCFLLCCIHKFPIILSLFPLLLSFFSSFLILLSNGSFLSFSLFYYLISLSWLLLKTFEVATWVVLNISIVNRKTCVGQRISTLRLVWSQSKRSLAFPWRPCRNLFSPASSYTSALCAVSCFF